ncbi:MAG: hypothetical protein IH605_06905 [Burkholderiales bacterium]|nr:hypothetical protein [Burkholderiales bacterium]
MRYLWLFVLLSGCATMEERAADVLATFGPYCEKLGYTKDTDPWRQCVQMEDAAAGARAYEMMRRHR